MERTLSQEDRIRRAEEIYYRRRNAVNLPRTATVNITPKKNYKFLKKVIIQIIICVLIYSVIYKLQSNTDSFSIDSIEYLKSTMSYDIDLNSVLEKAKKYMEAFNLVEGRLEENKTGENIVIDENQELSNNIQETEVPENEQVEENIAQNVEKLEEETSNLSKMEQDAEYIKSNFSLIKPVEGPITSRFGLRNPTTPTVPKDHTGIDIGVPEGTIIVASMEGTVEQVSSIGDYRKSCKDNKWRCIYTICTLQNNLCITRR